MIFGVVGPCARNSGTPCCDYPEAKILLEVHEVAVTNRTMSIPSLTVLTDAILHKDSYLYGPPSEYTHNALESFSAIGTLYAYHT